MPDVERPGRVPPQVTPTTGPSSSRYPALLLLAAAGLWSLNGLFIKTLHDSGLGGWTIAAYRSLFAALFLAPFAVRSYRRIEHPGWVLAAVAAFTAMCATFILATTHTTAANAIILQYTAPVWVFLLAPRLTGEQATREQFVALAFALVGVAVIFFCQYHPGQTGLLIGLGSGVVFGVQNVFFRRVRHVPPLLLTCLVCGGSAVLLLPLAHLLDPAALTLRLTGWLLLMGVVQFGLPYVLFSAAIARLSAQKTVLIILIETILNPFWVWWLHGETPLPSTLVGGALILAGVVYVSVAAPPRSRSA